MVPVAAFVIVLFEPVTMPLPAPAVIEPSLRTSVLKLPTSMPSLVALMLPVVAFVIVLPSPAWMPSSPAKRVPEFPIVLFERVSVDPRRC